MLVNSLFFGENFSFASYINLEHKFKHIIFINKPDSGGITLYTHACIVLGNVISLN